jgi:hypothetical protein
MRPFFRITNFLEAVKKVLNTLLLEEHELTLKSQIFYGSVEEK